MRREDGRCGLVGGRELGHHGETRRWGPALITLLVGQKTAKYGGGTQLLCRGFCGVGVGSGGTGGRTFLCSDQVWGLGYRTQRPGWILSGAESWQSPRGLSFSPSGTSPGGLLAECAWQGGLESGPWSLCVPWVCAQSSPTVCCGLS